MRAYVQELVPVIGGGQNGNGPQEEENTPLETGNHFGGPGGKIGKTRLGVPKIKEVELEKIIPQGSRLSKRERVAWPKNIQKS